MQISAAVKRRPLDLITNVYQPVHTFMQHSDMNVNSVYNSLNKILLKTVRDLL